MQASRRVHAVGPTDQPLLAIIGEAPGQEEERRGVPFIGSSGQLLNQMLASVGISRDDCYITNVVNQRPPHNNFNIFYEDSKRTKPTGALIGHRGRLRGELLSVKPKMIVAMGAEPMKALLPVMGIKNHRGCLYDVDLEGAVGRMIPTFHPAHVIRLYGDRPIVELDLKKAIRQARHPFTPTMEFKILPEFQDIKDWLLERHSPVALDIESIGPCTRSIGFAWSPTEAISIPLISKGQHHWGPETEILILQMLKDYLADPQVKKYLQNAPYDTTVLSTELGLHVDGIELDTMYSHHLLYPELPKGLDFLSSIHTDFPKYWGLPDQPHDEGNARYGCYDCCATFIVATAVIEELIERDLGRFYYERTHPTIFALTRMQNRGILIDKEAKEVERKRLFKEHEEALILLPKLIGHDVNPQSPKQVKELLYEEWRLPVQRKPGTSTITTDEDALRTLARRFPERAAVIRTILACRKANKLIGTYLDQKLDDGRARTSYGLAKTGRITSSQTIEGYGGNLQNIPRGEFRRLYVADPGKVLIKADLSQAEYMVFCWDAKVYEFIEQYTTNPEFDVHVLNATRIYEITEDQVTKVRRYNAKQGVYAGNYKIGALKFSRMFDIPFNEAKNLLDRYKQIRPELRLWWARIEDEIKTTRTLTNALGRQRIFFGRIDEALFRTAYDWVCQSAVADLINQALVTLDDLGYEMLLQVHDELVLQVEDTPATITGAIIDVRNAMEIPVKFPNVDPPMVIPAEIAVGPNWHDVKEYVA
jgi:DNA polymerase-1